MIKTKRIGKTGTGTLFMDLVLRASRQRPQPIRHLQQGHRLSTLAPAVGGCAIRSTWSITGKDRSAPQPMIAALLDGSAAVVIVRHRCPLLC